MDCTAARITSVNKGVHRVFKGMVVVSTGNGMYKVSLGNWHQVIYLL